MKFSGHCLCGSIQYEANTEIRSTSICHCTDCQRQTGTTNSLVIEVDEKELKLTGESLKTFITIGTDHGTSTHRSFCGNCGSPIVSKIDAFPGTVFVKAGTLNDTSWLNPSEELWCQSAQAWVLPIPGAQRFERDIPTELSAQQSGCPMGYGNESTTSVSLSPESATNVGC